MTDEERTEFDEAFAAGIRGEISVDEVADRLWALGITRLGTVMVVHRGDGPSLN